LAKKLLFASLFDVPKKSINQPVTCFYRMKTEKANINDAKEMLTVQKLAFQAQAKLYNIYTLPPLLETLDEVKAAFKTHTILKATQNGRLVGSVRLWSRMALVM
jgi:hypothetical protein